MRKFPQPHTADRVLDVLKAVLCEWRIEESRISKVLTDNGSNMVAAFIDLKSSPLDVEDELDDESTNAGVIADSGLQAHHSSHQPQVILRKTNLVTRMISCKWTKMLKTLESLRSRNCSMI